MTPSSLPEKRPAFEPPTSLVAPLAHDPGMRRPISTVAGAALVLLRAIAGGLWTLTVAFGWNGWLRAFTGIFGGDPSEDADVSVLGDGTTLVVFVVIASAVFVTEAVLGILILSGRNLARVLVLVFSTISITAAFVGWWTAGQEIRLTTTFVTIALDILILLALSSRSSAAYARRRERTVSRPTSTGD